MEDQPIGIQVSTLPLASSLNGNTSYFIVQGEILPYQRILKTSL